MKVIPTTLLALLVASGTSLRAQDTFSILAFDSLTQEVGAAGASCVDLMVWSLPTDFLAELFPGEGGVVTQASYLTANQIAIRNRFLAGDSPTQMMTFMQGNDATQDPSVRQYGAVRLGTVYPRAAAHTGSNCMNYKAHVVGPNYSIQGNILLGQAVLDSMEARFKREPGDLACKLMAAMQGANRIGADTRCSGNGTSSLFAFLKVSQPSDAAGLPGLLLSLRTPNGAGIEPIDSLQVLFDAAKTCTSQVNTGWQHPKVAHPYRIFPNPAQAYVTVNAAATGGYLRVYNAWGQTVWEERLMQQTLRLPVASWPSGIYTLDADGYRQRLLVLPH